MIQAEMYYTKAVVCINQGDYSTAENILQKAFLIVNNQVKDAYHSISLKISLHNTMCEIYKKKSSYSQALDELQTVLVYQNKSWQKKYVKEGQIAEAKFRLQEKEKKLELIEERERQQKKLLITTGISALIIIAILINFFWLRIKSVKRERIFLSKEKEEAILQAQLKEEEAKATEMRKRAIELEIELEKEKAEKQALEINRLQKEVIVGIAQIEYKNEILENISKSLGTKGSSESKEIKRLLDGKKKIDEHFDDYAEYIKNIHPDFYSRLQEKASQKLTTLDLKYCTYIYMNLDTKDIASILFVEPNTVRMTKYRLKQKLNLSKDDDLYYLIRNIINN